MNFAWKCHQDARCHLFPPQYLQPFSISFALFSWPLASIHIHTQIVLANWQKRIYHHFIISAKDLCVLLLLLTHFLTLINPYINVTQPKPTPPSFLLSSSFFFLLYLLIDRILKLIESRTCNLFSVFLSILSRYGNPRDIILVRSVISFSSFLLRWSHES